MRQRALLAALALALACAFAPATRAADAAAQDMSARAQYRAWLQQMKQAPRGPFAAIRWYCEDGSVLEPRPGACAERGGGVQHGEWSARTRTLRERGYLVGNLLVEFAPRYAAEPSAHDAALQQLLVERFLTGYDDGWIFRKARAYRGALQDDDERAGARDLLLAMLRNGASWLRVREAARLLPHDGEPAQLTRVRELSSSLAEREPRFAAERARLHNQPQAADAARVRDWAARADAALKPDLEALAQAIEAAFRPQPLPQRLEQIAAQVDDAALAGALREQAAAFDPQGAPQSQLAAAVATLALLREHFEAVAQGSPPLRLQALDASLAAETAALAAAASVLPQAASASRRQRLEWLGLAALGLQGAGLLTGRELDALRASLAGLPPGEVVLAEYRRGLEHLGRAPLWAERRLQHEFGEGIERLSEIEPAAALYTADRLRGSLLLFHAQLLQTLTEDADALAEASQELFGTRVAGGLKRLNPGLARGTLVLGARAPAGAPAVHLVSETTAELPPAAAILTADAGNPLSHVQLLARNLGVPNVVVARELVPQLEARQGRRVVVAASPGGAVRIVDDGPEWDRLFGELRAQAPTLVIDQAGLDLALKTPVSTADLGADDAGRRVGPKAAQVGELARRYPEQSAPGLAIPFGAYHAFLQQPLRKGGPPMQQWLRERYARIAPLRELDPARHARELKAYLATVRRWMARAPLPAGLREQLFDAMHARFGVPGTYGVFVRSDTNVEDLPGFTGAGLNRTVPNVVGFDAVLAALREVWASPFSERAFGWRARLLDQPDQVHVSVLLHQSVPAEKSGVMITADVDDGSDDALTIVASAGVGGGVDSEAAETLRIALDDEAPQLLASATARTRRELDPAGGLRRVPAPAPEALLTPQELAQLVDFARELPEDYPGLRDPEGRAAPADIEFAFVDGRLVLLQIRPFVQGDAAPRWQRLAELDGELRRAGARTVDLRAPAGERS